MTPSPTGAPRRRRRSRPLPWQLPAALLLLLALIFLLVRRDRAGAEEPLGEPILPAPTATGGAVADPLAGEPTSPLESAERVALLLLGTDGRDEEDGPPRTDFIALAVLDGERATLISLPRDLWVPIPGYGEGKLNTAYFLGSIEGRGPELASETVEGVTGVGVDHIVEVDFDGFRRLVDDLGGVDIDVPEAIDDPEFPDESYGTFRLVIPAGPQHFDGEQALRYARTRHGSSDLARAERQQRVIMAIRDRLLHPSVLPRLPALGRTAHGMVESDLSLGDLFALARRGLRLDRDAIAMERVGADLVTPVLTWNGQDALAYDSAELREAIRGWLERP